MHQAYLQSLEVCHDLLAGEVALANTNVQVALFIGAVLHLSTLEVADSLPPVTPQSDMGNNYCPWLLQRCLPLLQTGATLAEKPHI